jgi:hypothetical protein
MGKACEAGTKRPRKARTAGVCGMQGIQILQQEHGWRCGIAHPDNAFHWNASRVCSPATSAPERPGITASAQRRDGAHLTQTSRCCSREDTSETPLKSEGRHRSNKEADESVQPLPRRSPKRNQFRMPSGTVSLCCPLRIPPNPVDFSSLSLL